MKTPSKKTSAEEDLGEETEEKPEELSIEKEESMEVEEELEKTEEEQPIEETEAEEELEEAGERAEEEIAEEEVLEEEITEPIEEPTEEEEAEEERHERREKEEIEEEIVEERIYTIPLGRAWVSPPKKRAPRAIRIIRGFIIRHMKIKTDAVEEEEAERLVISNEVNEKIWSSGIKNPPRKIRIRAVKDKEGTVTLRLAEED